MAKLATVAKTQPQERKFKLSYFVLMMAFSACMYGCYTAVSQNQLRVLLKKTDGDAIVPVGYMVGDGLLIADVDNMPLSPPKFNRTCGNWVPDGSMYHEREKVEQFLTCKPDGFGSQGGIQYIYKRTIGVNR